MVFTRQKAMPSVLARVDVATQTELPQKHAATQVSGCRECLGLSLFTHGSHVDSCVRCDQVDDLLCMVAELWEEVERLRSIREAEKEIDWWCHALSPPRQEQEQQQPPVRTHDQGDPVSPHTGLKAAAQRRRVNGGESTLVAAGEGLPCPPRLPRCLCTTGMRPWRWKASQWRMGTTVYLHQRCRPGQKNIPLLLTPPPQGREDWL